MASQRTQVEITNRTVPRFRIGSKVIADRSFRGRLQKFVKMIDNIQILNPDMKLKRREIKKVKQHIQFYQLKVKQREQGGQKWPRLTSMTKTKNLSGFVISKKKYCFIPLNILK